MLCVGVSRGVRVVRTCGFAGGRGLGVDGFCPLDQATAGSQRAQVLPSFARSSARSVVSRFDSVLRESSYPPRFGSREDRDLTDPFSRSALLLGTNKEVK